MQVDDEDLDARLSEVLHGEIQEKGYMMADKPTLELSSFHPIEEDYSQGIRECISQGVLGSPRHGHHITVTTPRLPHHGHHTTVTKPRFNIVFDRQPLH